MNRLERKKERLKSEYLLLNYMVSEERGRKVLEGANLPSEPEKWNQWHRIILVESDQDFFDSCDEYFLNGLRAGIRRDFYYMNLTARQSLLFFEKVNCDYMLIAKKIMDYLKQRSMIRFYLSVSREFYGYRNLSSILKELNSLLDEKYYFPDKRIFMEEDEELLRTESESQDSLIMQGIADDVWKKDAQSLVDHYRILEEKYRDSRKYSAMYVKFIFSGVVEELCQDAGFGDGIELAGEISRIYCSNNMTDIQKIAKENVIKYQEYLTLLYAETKKKIPAVRSYIKQHCKDALNIETIAEEAGLHPGYLAYIFKKEIGANLVEYIHYIRIVTGGELLCSTDWSVWKISQEVGFATEEYFEECFYRHFGDTPREYREHCRTAE